MKLSVASSLFLSLVTPALGQTSEAYDLSACLETEDCPYTNDGECDAEGGIICREGSDCFDCDPCQAHHLDCGACTSTPGCAYCAKGSLCFPDPVDPVWFALLGKDTICEADDWNDTCEAVFEDNFFTDPLYDGMKWAYELVKVEPVWEMGLTGAGVHVRVDDDGVDSQHPEFAGRYDINMSCYIYESESPTDTHGTGTASLIAAAGGNDMCAVGMAPNATISSCNVNGQGSLPEPLEETFLYKVESVDISSNSLGPVPCEVGRRRRRHLQEDDECPVDPDRELSPCAPEAACIVNGTNDETCLNAIVAYCNNFLNFDHDYEICQNVLHAFTVCRFPGLPDEVEAAFANGTTYGRGGLGTIFVFAAGNERTEGSDANYDTNSISRYTIAVGAVGKRGLHASYSNTGANVLVSAPGGDFEYINNNLVANPTVAGGGCANQGPGTSFACPTVSGVIALILEANSGLGWRDVQAILATTSAQSDEEDESWATNAAGLHHSNKYGFGIINAYDAVMAAKNWTNMPPEKNVTVQSGTVDLPLPNNPGTTVSSSVVVDGEDNFVVESVYLFVKLLHGSRGDLDVRLTSPSGMESVMTSAGRPEETVLPLEEDWQLMTVRNYYENPNGNWTLSITDDHPNENDWCMNLPFVVLNETTGEPILDPFSGREDACGLIEAEAIYDPENAGCRDGEILITEEELKSIVSITNETADVACCICGGGSNGEAKLVSWKLEIFGHYAKDGMEDDGEEEMSDMDVEEEDPAAVEKTDADEDGGSKEQESGSNPDNADATVPMLSSSGLETATSGFPLAVATVAAWMMV